MKQSRITHSLFQSLPGSGPSSTVNTGISLPMRGPGSTALLFSMPSYRLNKVQITVLVRKSFLSLTPMCTILEKCLSGNQRILRCVFS